MAFGKFLQIFVLYLNVNILNMQEYVGEESCNLWKYKMLENGILKWLKWYIYYKKNFITFFFYADRIILLETLSMMIK